MLWFFITVQLISHFKQWIVYIALKISFFYCRLTRRIQLFSHSSKRLFGFTVDSVLTLICIICFRNQLNSTIVAQLPMLPAKFPAVVKFLIEYYIWNIDHPISRQKWRQLKCADRTWWKGNFGIIHFPRQQWTANSLDQPKQPTYL